MYPDVKWSFAKTWSKSLSSLIAMAKQQGKIPHLAVFHLYKTLPSIFKELYLSVARKVIVLIPQQNLSLDLNSYLLTLVNFVFKGLPSLSKHLLLHPFKMFTIYFRSSSQVAVLLYRELSWHVLSSLLHVFTGRLRLQQFCVIPCHPHAFMCHRAGWLPFR